MGDPTANPKHKLCHDGNAYYEQKKYKEAIKAWKDALPDEDARENLKTIQQRGQWKE